MILGSFGSSIRYFFSLAFDKGPSRLLEVAENLEPTRSVNNEIIEKQDALIGMLYREEDASPEIRELKQEVESKKAVLQKRRALFPKL